VKAIDRQADKVGGNKIAQKARGSRLERQAPGQRWRVSCDSGACRMRA
jgi:hypothetical protein